MFVGLYSILVCKQIQLKKHLANFKGKVFLFQMTYVLSQYVKTAGEKGLKASKVIFINTAR